MTDRAKRIVIPDWQHSLTGVRRPVCFADPLCRSDPRLLAAVPPSDVAPCARPAARCDPRPRGAHRGERVALPRSQCSPALRQLSPRARPCGLVAASRCRRAASPAGADLRSPRGADRARPRQHARAASGRAHRRQGDLSRRGALLVQLLRQGERPALACDDAAGRGAFCTARLDTAGVHGTLALRAPSPRAAGATSA